MEANNKICNRLNIIIYYFINISYDGTPKEYYQLNYIPDDRDFYIPDSLKQGGYMAEIGFKIQNRDTFEEVKELIVEVVDNANKEGISVCINRNGINIPDLINSRSRCEYNGMIFITEKNHGSYNRQLDDKELKEIFDYIIESRKK